MVFKRRDSLGMVVSLVCVCGGNDFSVRGQLSMFPKNDSLVDKQLICRNCGAVLPKNEKTFLIYPPPPEKVITP